MAQRNASYSPAWLHGPPQPMGKVSWLCGQWHGFGRAYQRLRPISVRVILYPVSGQAELRSFFTLDMMAFTCVTRAALLCWPHLQNLQPVSVLLRTWFGAGWSGNSSFPRSSSLAVFIRSGQTQVGSTQVTWRPQGKSQEWATLSKHEVHPHFYGYSVTC